MAAFARRHQTLILLLSLITTSIYLMSLDIRNPDKTIIIERAIIAIVAPLQSFTTAVYNGIARAIETYFSLVNTNKENRRLKETISRLEAEKAQLIEAAIQNTRLKKIVNLDESRRFMLQACSVIGVDPSKLFSSVFIDRGSSDGLSRNMPAITYDGVVGKIVKVSPHAARVQLLTDTRSSVAVIAQRSRAPGILQGNGSSVCEMAYIDADADIKSGDVLLTSGLGGIFPSGLRVGRVRSVVKKEGAMTKSARVTVFVNVHQLEEVLILVAEQKEEIERLKEEEW
ncbi:MAG: rod shape-determining protein MreC [Candidatus Coatesbacteria bacterium]|nr:rod shape-determining protein MreC [Candidatus Coatesbacteria bacterium]